MASVSVCVCSNRHHPPKAALALNHLIAFMARDESLEKFAFHCQGNVSLLSCGRQDAVQNSIKNGFSHLLFIDDDMTYPPEGAKRLLARGKRIIGVNALKKVPGVHYQVRALNDKELVSKGRAGIEEVHSMGFGFMLVDLDVFVKCPAPNFEIRWNGTGYTGEDHYFCNQARAAGEKIWVDHDLSALCTHVGDHGYSYK